MKSMISFQQSIALLFGALIVGVAVCSMGDFLFSDIDNSPVRSGPEYEAIRFDAMRDCQNRGKWLDIFRNRGTGRDWLDNAAISLRGKEN